MAALRALVAEKFPSPGEQAPLPRLRTGCTALDQQGGLKRGAVTEICGPVAAGQLVLGALLAAASRERFFLALIDAADAFEPGDWPAAQLRRMLWVMGGTAEDSLKAADLLLRDGNLPLLMLDFQTVPARQLQKVPVSTWHRFHRVAAQSAVSFVVLTPEPMVEGAPSRIALRFSVSLPAALLEPREALLAQVDAQIFERGAATVPSFEVLPISA